MLFRSGYSCPCADPEGKASARPRIRKQLQKFKLAVRKIAREEIGEEVAEWFKAGKKKGRSLERLGVGSFAAAPGLQVKVCAEVQEHLDKEVLKANCNKAKDYEEQKAGQKEVTRRKLLLKGKVTWSANVKKLHPKLLAHFNPEAVLEKPEDARSLKTENLKRSRTSCSRLAALPLHDDLKATSKRGCKRACTATSEPILKLRMGMLSARLQARFGYLCTGES